MSSPIEPLEIELLVTEDQRRTDRETDELIEELRAAEFEGKGSQP
tara:strand:+ start:701 stop:835 length:135 start_codon:yes stop_codon:yes gene_type:complete